MVYFYPADSNYFSYSYYFLDLPFDAASHDIFTWVV
jgi:hypothetical protein